MFAARRLAPALAAAVCTLVVPALAQATTYYVSSSGSDTAAGTAVTAPWRTIGRVNRACPAPGDSVLFEGGAAFGDATLMPSCSGTSSAPVSYGSYGVGKAQLRLGLWLAGGDHDLVFDGLDLSSPSSGIVASAATGTGVHDIAVRNSVIHDTIATGVYAQPQDTGWQIVGNTIRHTGDSGIINWSPGMLVAGNTITDTGWNYGALGYGTHGVYAKGPDMVIRDNDFSQNANGQSISLRMHGIRVLRNTIHDTPYAVAFFNYDTQNSGTFSVYANRIWNVSGYVFYYNGTTNTGAPSAISAVWNSNTALVTSGGEGVNLSEMTAATAEVANSIFSGSIGSGYRGCATCSEHHNLWYGVSWNRPAGTGDVFAAPGLSSPPALAPSMGSPATDAGTTSARLAYAAACDGLPLDYCGARPDLGGVEYVTGTAADATPPTAPAGVSVSAGAASATLTWQAASDNVGVAGYDVYVGSARQGSTSSTSYALASLQCATTYTAGVAAYDAAGNRSAVATAAFTTSACTSSAPPAQLPGSAPTVRITSPTAGSRTGVTLTAAADAAAAAGIASVTFRVDGATACVDTTAPYTCPLTVAKGQHTLTALVTDMGGATASASLQFQAQAKAGSAVRTVAAAKRTKAQSRPTKGKARPKSNPPHRTRTR